MVFHHLLWNLLASVKNKQNKVNYRIYYYRRSYTLNIHCVTLCKSLCFSAVLLQKSKFWQVYYRLNLHVQLKCSDSKVALLIVSAAYLLLCGLTKSVFSTSFSEIFAAIFKVHTTLKQAATADMKVTVKVCHHFSINADHESCNISEEKYCLLSISWPRTSILTRNCCL